jgi:hypothetical protein
MRTTRSDRRRLLAAQWRLLLAAQWSGFSLLSAAGEPDA